MSRTELQLAGGGGRARPWWRLAGRMLVGCLIVIAAVAATVATGALLEVKSFTDALRLSPQLKLGGELTGVSTGKPQTILLIGSDKRAKGAVDATSPPRSDTMILVRLDPSQPDTTMLSIPRDLKVTIRPDHGKPTVQKMNAAYTMGGAKLTVRTIKQVLGIKINHVVDINFAGFKALVDYVGCVYTQVDRRYYHSNYGLPASQTYDEIDIQPGYQKLCGDDALHYVRYRHGDTDLVRSARQQDFLRDIKSQVGAGGLISKRHGLEKIFGKYTNTDIRSNDDVLKLLGLVVGSISHPIHQVVFKSSLGPSYVTATAAQLRDTAHEFLTGGGSTGHVRATKSKKRSSPVPLTPATADELAQARGVGATLRFPMYYPSGRVTTAGALPDTVRSYMLHGHPAYVTVVDQGGLGQFYDLEGTTWQDAPILSNPSQTLTVRGRKLQLYFEGSHLRLVAWHDGPGVYWLINTLQDILTNKQMLAIAAAAKPL
jgi:LCP family protein required for cell wall assembly